jgi:hypothetical protein
MGICKYNLLKTFDLDEEEESVKHIPNIFQKARFLSAFLLSSSLTLLLALINFSSSAFSV